MCSLYRCGCHCICSLTRWRVVQPDECILASINAVPREFATEEGAAFMGAVLADAHIKGAMLAHRHIRCSRHRLLGLGRCGSNLGMLSLDTIVGGGRCDALRCTAACLPLAPRGRTCATTRAYSSSWLFLCVQHVSDHFCLRSPDAGAVSVRYPSSNRLSHT